MNHWLILLLTIVAMWAIVLVFMWWWTTENWDWASAELKPPRPVPQETKVTVARRLAHHWQMLETLSDLSEIQTEQRKKLEQRVEALEKDNRWHRTAAELLMNLEPRLAEVENVMNQIHKLEPPLPLAAIPSQVTDASITGANWDVAEQESIPPESPASWRSGQTTMTGGPVAPDSEYADPSDAST